jgi:hypothetical protein
MFKPHGYSPTMEKKEEKTGYDALMHEVCVELGFCGSLRDGQSTHVDFIIPPYGPVTVDQFVEWVFLADGLNPNADVDKSQHLKDALKSAFIRHMGAEVVDAERLQWSAARRSYSAGPQSSG